MKGKYRLCVGAQIQLLDKIRKGPSIYYDREKIISEGEKRRKKSEKKIKIKEKDIPWFYKQT